MALNSGVQAIHPGYGLLSENADFAQRCAENNIVFIGPSSDVIRKMGDKDEARKTMHQAGVPVIAGSDILTDVESAKKTAEEIGYPLLLKARSGGGGRGIRLVEKAEDFEKAYLNAQSEAQAAFGDGALSVSYTHLDVYKRQAVACRGIMFLRPFRV